MICHDFLSLSYVHECNEIDFARSVNTLSVATLINSQGPVVQRPINTNPGLSFNLGFFFSCLKEFSQMSFSFPSF